MKTIPPSSPVPPHPSVDIVDRHPVTSSRKVAEYFGKNHKDVLRTIQNLDCSPEFTERNFAPSEFTDSTGRKLLEYLLTKNGFIFLVMGFTGAKAAKLKEAYIAEFDRMEEEIRSLELAGRTSLRSRSDSGEALERQARTPIQRLILVALARHAGPDGFCEVNQNKLAEETGLWRSTVNRNLKALESLGLIESRPIPGEHLKKYGFRSGRVFSSPSGPKSCPPLPPERPSGVRLTPIRQDLLRRTVVRKAEEFALAPGKIWYLLMDAFRMPSHLHLAPEFFERALLYLETLHLPGETRTKKISALNSSTIIGGRG